MGEIEVYGWGKWPEHLLTKKQMSDAGFQVGKKLPPPKGKVRRSKSPDGWMYLYDNSCGVPKRKISEAQKAALEKAQINSKRIEVQCCKCGDFILDRRGRFLTVTRKRYDEKDYSNVVCHICRDRDSVEGWAREMLSGEFVILDTETTGLSEPDIVQIAVIDQGGQVLIDTLVKPTKEILPDAIAIHGITSEMVADAPTFDKIYDDIVAVLSGKTVAIYNADFDSRALYYSGAPYGLTKLDYKYCCVMEMYSQYCGDWSEYHGDYRWQSLTGGDHTALGDCLATLKIIKEMAEAK